jgi:chromosomal replication initiator protein
MRVGIFTAGAFMRAVGSAFRRDTIDVLHEDLVGWDVFLLEDVQALVERRDAQEELLSLVEAFGDASRMVVVSGNKSPDRLEGFDPRLVSRLASGIVAQVAAPGVAARVHMLAQRAHAAHVNVPEEVLQLIASRIPSDLRRMGGALQKVIANASLAEQEITRELAGEVLAQLGVTDAA